MTASNATVTRQKKLLIANIATFAAELGKYRPHFAAFPLEKLRRIMDYCDDILMIQESEEMK